MSINPVPVIGPAEWEQATGSGQRTAQPPPSPGTTDSTNAASRPAQQVRPAQSASASPELPADQVQLQRDSETDNQIVIKYVDHSGNLILQVPSSEVLGVSRSIDQDFARAEKARSNAVVTSASEGGQSHGH